ncbi:MAG: glycosyltransferase family 4 protein [Roseiflexaceae bacterium]
MQHTLNHDKQNRADGHSGRIGYVLKRYPRYSETFVVNEILAHEVAGVEIEIFALRPTVDRHFQDIISRVRAPVNYLYLPADGLMADTLAADALKAADFWAAVEATARTIPDIWDHLSAAKGETARDVYQALILAREVRRKQLNHLHAHFATSAATVTRLAARFSGISYSLTAHAKDIFHESVQLDDLRRKLVEARAVITVSDFNVQYLQGIFGADAESVRRIYNGMDLDRFPYRTPAHRPPVILSVGRLVEKKGFGDLIEACSILADHGLSFTCRIVGSGPLEGVLREQIKRLGLDRVVELIGPRPQHEVIALVQGAAAFAAPCVIGEDGNRDGMPTVLLEAMALGTPCVATDVTGIPEAIRHGKTGLIVPQNDPPALAEALARLIKHPDLRMNLASSARELIEDAFDIQRNATELRSFWPVQELLETEVAVCA